MDLIPCDEITLETTMKLILIILLVFPCIKALDLDVKKGQDKNREGKGIISITI